jgi:uncharacterized protein (DUF983 family)
MIFINTIVNRKSYLCKNFLQMLKKGTKLYSILTGTCPKCQNESMYASKINLNLFKILKMHDNCTHCGLKYQIEPSFFYGAMYVSYGLNVAFGIAVFILTTFFFNLPLKFSFMTIIIGIILLQPFVLRWSRNIYINFFISYDSKSDIK